MRISLPVTVTVKPVPDDFTPPNTIQGLLVTIPNYLDIELQDNGPAIWVSSTPPADTNGAWLRIQPAPEPPEVLVFYKSAWRKIASGNPNEVRVFVGDPSVYFDSTGFGIVGGEWDGWALCNGANGTSNLQNHFSVPGYRFDSTNGWITNIGTLINTFGSGMIGGTGEAQLSSADIITPKDQPSGGWALFQIQLWNLPALIVGVNTREGFQPTHATDLTTTNSGQSGGTVGVFTYPAQNQAQMVQTPINRLPPFIAVGYAQFVGYA